MRTTVQSIFTDREQSMTELLCALIECKTLGMGPEMERAFSLVSARLLESGITSELVMNRLGNPTLVARLDSGVPGPNVLLQGHMDVVPVADDWASDPFTPTIDAGMLYGRGSCDMKAGIAAFIQVMQVAADTHSMRAGSLTLLLDIDEESGSDTGLIPFIEEFGLGGYDWAICAEPTAMRPLLGNRGLIWASITVRGRASHAGIPHAGVNPIPVLAEMIGALPEPPDIPGVLGGLGPSMTPTMVTSGEAINSIPAAATVRLDRRVVPPENPETVRAALTEFVAGFAAKYPEHGVTIEFLKDWPPCLLDSDSSLAAAAAAVTEQHGFNGTFGFDDPCDDASFLSAAGVPTLLWGPGDPEMAHVSNEGLSLEQLFIAPRMYWATLQRLGVVKDE